MAVALSQTMWWGQALQQAPMHTLHALHTQHADFEQTEEQVPG